MIRPNIVLCGAIGAGKSWVASYLVKEHGYAAVNFADKLKSVAADVFGIPHRNVFGNQADKAEPLAMVRDAAGVPQTARRVLEHLGTEGFRALDPDVWVKYAMREVRKQNAVAIPVVIGDGRFPNEFAAVRAYAGRGYGGEVWKVVKVGGTEIRTGHASDELWRDVTPDYTLVARLGDLDALMHQVDLRLAL